MTQYALVTKFTGFKPEDVTSILEIDMFVSVAIFRRTVGFIHPL
jgi:hypothetical protein